ncbi:hypothetical protein HON58_05320 [Candidatus Peregrinibacteria bacterium]|nr:hypothetical protein [Candidatus Peregrinibacteria bacterium]
MKNFTLNKVLTIPLIAYSFWLIFAYKYHFIDGANLIFHEAGHVIFMALGKTMSFLGGTLTQILIPLIFGIYFLRKKKLFEMCVMGVWLGENFLDTVDYVADAQKQALPLLGGPASTHDWNWILTKFNVLTHAETIGTGFYILGASIVAISATYAIRISFFTKED